MPSDFLILISVLISLPIGTIAMLFLCQKNWALTLWLPLLIISGVLLYGALAPVPWREFFQNHGSDYGFVAMGIGFYLMVALPVSAGIGICLIVLLVAFPRKNAWNLKGFFAGLSAAAVTLAVAWLVVSDPKITVQVVDADNQPMPGVRVKFTTYQRLSDHIIRLGIKVTDENGKVTMRVPIDSWEASVWSPDYEFQTEPTRNAPFTGRKAWIGMSVPRDNYRMLRLSEGWYQANWGKLAPTHSQIGYFEKMRKFKITVRDKDKIISADIQQALHQRLLDILNEPDKYAHVFNEGDESYDYDRLETFNEFPLFVQIFQKYPKFQSDKFRFTSSMSDRIYYCWESSVEKATHNNNKEGYFDYRALCQWLNLDASYQAVPSSVPVIQAKLKEMAKMLLDLEKTDWNSGHIEVFRKLGILSKDSVPEFLEVMVSAAKEREINFSQALKNAQPDVEQVRVYFDYPDPMIALSAIQSVSEKLQGQDAVVALEKINELADYLNPHSKKQVNISRDMGGLTYNILTSATKNFTTEEAAAALACVKKMPCAGEASLQPLIQALARKAAQE